MNNVAALGRLSEISEGEEINASSSTWTIFITGHGFAVCQTIGLVLDWEEAGDCLCRSLVATLDISVGVYVPGYRTV